MRQVHFGINSPEIKAEIDVTSTLPDMGESHVYTQLITELIEEAHTDFWQKNERELQPYEFHGLVLAALVRHYAVGFDPDFKYPAHELLQMLINEVKAEYLQEILPNFDDDEDDE